MSNEIIVQETAYEVYTQRTNGERWPLYSVERRGLDRWCVLWSASIYNFVTGEWEFEPIPSTRSDEFIADTRRPLEVCLEQAKELVRAKIGVEQNA